MNKLVFKFHWSFLLLGVLMIVCGNSLLLFCYIITCVLHEFGHALMGKMLGYKLNIISLMPYGASLSGNNVPFKAKDEVLIAVAGPVVNLLLILLLISLWWFFPTCYGYTQEFFLSNVSTIFFNLMPVYPLDGGRVLVGILNIKLDRKKSLKIARIIGGVVTIGFFAMFIISAVKNTINYSLGINSFFLLIGLFSDDKSIYYINTQNTNLKINNLNKGLLLKSIVISQNATIYDAYKLLDKNNINQIYIMDDNLKIKSLLMEIDLQKLILSKPLDTKLSQII